MSAQIASLIEAVDQAAALLRAHGDTSTWPRLVDLATRLRSGDNNAIVGVVSEATGGAGSLNDMSLHPAAADARLRKAIHLSEALARSIAHELGVVLVR